MKLLVTGAKGFVGSNLCAHLEANGLGELLMFDRDSAPALLDEYAHVCDFVFHLAGVNRPMAEADFEENVTLTAQLLESLQRHHKRVPVLYSSSTQASLDNAYGRSKKEAETLVFAYCARANADVYVYRLPGVFGKWCAPNYNSVVATFCYNTARGVPLRIDDPDTAIELAYIDDVAASFASALQGSVFMKDGYCAIPTTYTVSVGHLADTIGAFRSQSERYVPDLGDTFTRRLYSTYLSYLPKDALVQQLRTHRDTRGTFTECMKSPTGGQVSVNTAKPGITKGGHWHQSKAETFIVVSGEGTIRLKKLETDEVLEFVSSGAQPQAVTIPPGYIHEVRNTGQDDMVMLIWASEVFDPQHPDTYTAKLDG